MRVSRISRAAVIHSTNLRNKGNVFVSKVATSPSNFEAFKLLFDFEVPQKSSWMDMKKNIFSFWGDLF